MNSPTNIRAFEGVAPKLGARVYVDDLALVLGRTQLGEDASVWPFAVLRGDVNEIFIGARSNVQDGSVLHVAHDGPIAPGGIALHIGDDVTVGHKVMLHACRIGHRCLVGMSSIVLDGASIQDDVMLGAGSLVPPGKTLASRGLYLGNPAQRVRDLTDKEIGQLSYLAKHYVRLKDRHLAEQLARRTR
jgi:carbonic anhydrase/acetyltransferase-like protein (isoleucine patch superfamily)